MSRSWSCGVLNCQLGLGAVRDTAPCRLAVTLSITTPPYARTAGRSMSAVGLPVIAE